MDPLVQTQAWVTAVVVGLDLCPFAAAPLAADQVRFALSRGDGLAEVLAELLEEAGGMMAPGGARTVLLVVPALDFDDLLEVCAIGEVLLAEQGWDDALQLIAFHPDWLPEGADAEDPANATNRSPHPMVHLLRNADVALAEREHPDVGGIPERNIARLRSLGWPAIDRLLNETPECPRGER